MPLERPSRELVGQAASAIGHGAAEPGQSFPPLGTFTAEADAGQRNLAFSARIIVRFQPDFVHE
jgi:hypothetical protein